MSSRRWRIDALRRLAESTTFPAEADAARKKADELELLSDDEADADPCSADCDDVAFPSFDDAMRANWRNLMMEAQAISDAEKVLGAVRYRIGEWLVPGIGPPVDKDGLLKLYTKAAA